MTTETLFQLANKINALQVEVECNQIRIGKLLSDARDRVNKETNMSFPEWCKNYLRKKDGSPFSALTIKYYIKIGKHPEVLQKNKERNNEKIKELRKASKQKASDWNKNWQKGLYVAPERTPSVYNQLSVNDEVNLLMDLWERTSESARKRFIALIRKEIK